MKNLIETLMLGELKGYGKFYLFKQKAKDYDENPTKTFPYSNKRFPNVKKLYFDMQFNSTMKPKIYMREHDSYRDLKYTIVTDDVVLAKFALAQNLLTQKSRATVVLEKLSELMNTIPINELEILTNKLDGILNDICEK